MKKVIVNNWIQFSPVNCIIYIQDHLSTTRCKMLVSVLDSFQSCQLYNIYTGSSLVRTKDKNVTVIVSNWIFISAEYCQLHNLY